MSSVETVHVLSSGTAGSFSSENNLPLPFDDSLADAMANLPPLRPPSPGTAQAVDGGNFRQVLGLPEQVGSFISENNKPFPLDDSLADAMAKLPPLRPPTPGTAQSVDGGNFRQVLGLQEQVGSFNSENNIPLPSDDSLADAMANLPPSQPPTLGTAQSVDGGNFTLVPGLQQQVGSFKPLPSDDSLADAMANLPPSQPPTPGTAQSVDGGNFTLVPGLQEHVDMVLRDRLNEIGLTASNEFGYYSLRFYELEKHANLAFEHVSKLHEFVDNKITLLESILSITEAHVQEAFHEIVKWREMYFNLRNRVTLAPLIASPVDIPAPSSRSFNIQSAGMSRGYPTHRLYESGGNLYV